MKCTAKNAQGGRCGADAMKGSRRCFWHAPKTTRAAREARRRGGQNRMLALREPLVPVLEAGRSEALARAEPPEWWNLDTRDAVLGAVRDVGRAAIARRLDPRTANTALQAMQMLLAADDARLAEERAQRQWAREQLRDRIDQLQEEIEHVKTTADLDRLEGLVEYIATLAARAKV